MFKLTELLEKNRVELSLLEALDNGKTAKIADSVDLDFAIKTYRYYAGYCDKILGDTIPLHGNFFGYTRREPIGVCAQIIPWNFPILMQAWKLAPAFAAGCTVVMKSAEQTPLSALRVAELIKEAGFPDGVFNMLSGFGETAGRHLVAHPGVDKVAFTGSTQVGREIMGNSAKNNLKHVSLELGGKSPNIVLDDADIGKAIRNSTGGLFFNAGQCCNAASRTFVHEKIYDEFVEKATAEAKKIKVGDQFSDDTEQGPLISEEQHKKVLGFIESGKKEGASCTVGGGRHGDKGYHVQPTVFANVNDDMKIAKEEIFGPVMSILKISDIDEAIERANNTEYGLAAAVFTESIDNAIYVSNALRAGQVYVNTYGAPQPTVPFGGFKNSGIGRELGHQGLDNYLEDKTVVFATRKGTLP
jgi:aldehyde dehydrogenase (NAD+)